MDLKRSVSIAVFNLIVTTLVVCGQHEEYIEQPSGRERTELTEGFITEKISSLQNSLDETVNEISRFADYTVLNQLLGFKNEIASRLNNLRIQVEQIELKTVRPDWFKGPNGYKYWYSAGYYFYYPDAKKFCSDIGAKLVTVGARNKTTLNWILNKIVVPRGVSTWLGVDDLENQHSWVWLDGFPGSRDNIGWHFAEPNSVANDERCAELASTHGFKANDINCWRAKAALCEKKL